ncbi:MAG: tetratricopeptide repeat protein [Limisphaerales bacterium]
MSAAELFRKRPATLVSVGLVLITFLLYLPMLRHDFINYDDPDYLLGNSHVNHGLTWSGIVWAFQSSASANWHPLTWISHMLDCQFFGLHPAGHHLVNLLFHIANTLLLFLLLKNLTGAVWRSAFVAALFAWHPLHVESVAWASERKDVLSAFFWMLTLLAYARFVKLSAIQPSKSRIFYALALLAFACGLMSKPMVVTLPFVLLLLDFWPLKRLEIQNSKFIIQNAFKLLLEKIPFLALTIASCLVTMRVQNGARWSSAALGLPFRLENAAMSYVRYISKIFWPTDLALIYPYPHSWPLAAVIAVVMVLALLSLIFVAQANRFPYLAVGWFWFLGALVPAIGLVQVGVQSMADRYSYLPSIGIFILAAWGANDLFNRWPEQKKFLPIAACVALIACLGLTELQLGYWQNSYTIFLHAVEVTDGNYAADDCLGKTLDNIGETNAAVQYYTEAVRIEPDYPMAQFDLGMLDVELGNMADASNRLAAAARLDPHNPVMQFDFGVFLAQHHAPAEAAVHFKAALAAQPDFPQAQQQLDLLQNTNPVSIH